MKILHLDDVQAVPVELAGASGVDVRVLIGQAAGAPNFTMRLFELAAGGRTPYHRHDYEHEVFVLSGRGCVWQGDEQTELSPGTAVLIEPMEWHGFEADGVEGMRLLCLVPNRAYLPGQFRVDEGAWVPDAGRQEPGESTQRVQSAGQPASVIAQDAEKLAEPWLDLSVLEGYEFVIERPMIPGDTLTLRKRKPPPER